METFDRDSGSLLRKVTLKKFKSDDKCIKVYGIL